jgi:peroxiredoxin Q/BCP
MATRSPLTTAPPFQLPTQKGDMQSLADYLEKGPVILAFHRGTWCPNCRTRFAELAMNAPAYAALGWQVVAVVAQKSTAVRRYIEDKGLPFNILIDSTREVSKAYGVWQRIGIDAWNIARPSLFLVEPDGKIRYSFVARRQDEFPTHEEIVKEIGDRR